MKARLVEQFKQLFGPEGDIRAYFAPGRVNLIGEHTDYNGGHVFPCALTLGTYAIARKREDDRLRLYSANFESLGVIESSLNDRFRQRQQDGRIIRRELCGHLKNVDISLQTDLIF